MLKAADKRSMYSIRYILDAIYNPATFLCNRLVVLMPAAVAQRRRCRYNAKNPHFMIDASHACWISGCCAASNPKMTFRTQNSRVGVCTLAPPGYCPFVISHDVVVVIPGKDAFKPTLQSDSYRQLLRRLPSLRRCASGPALNASSHRSKSPPRASRSSLCKSRAQRKLHLSLLEWHFVPRARM